MNYWRGSLQLLRFELKRDWLSFIFNILLYTYLAFVFSPLADPSSDLYNQMKWYSNFFYISILPCMGFVMNRTIFRYWQDDLYSRRVAMWRTMPIAVGEIVWARLLHLKLMMGMGIFYYFGVQYVLLQLWYTAPSPAAYVGHALVWYAYALAVGVLFVYWEICYSGKVFVIISFLYTFICVGVTALLHGLGMNANAYIMKQIGGSGWWLLLLVSLAIAAGAVVGGAALMTAKLRKRSVR